MMGTGLRAATALAALLALAGCGGTLSDLQDAKEAAAAGRYAAIADDETSCSPSEEGCAQLRLVTADACNRLADTATTVPDRRRRLDCAVRNYDAALAGTAAKPDPQVSAAAIEPALLDAVARRRALAESRNDAEVQNTSLLQRATAVQRGPRARPIGYLYAADAMLAGVQIAGERGGCDRIAEAVRTLSMAQADGTEYAERARALERAAGQERQARGCGA